MTATFYDRQDEHNPANGRTYFEASSLLRLLKDMSRRPPFFCEILNEKGFKLLIGMGGVRSCIQHSAVDGSPPYVMATSKESQPEADDMEYLIGNTLTPVPRRYILRFELACEVISFFVETGEKSLLVEWEEI